MAICQTTRSCAAHIVLWVSFACTSLVAAGDLHIQSLHKGTQHDDLYGMCFEGSKGFAVGGFGLMLLSNDGGASWGEQDAFTDVALLDVDCSASANLIVGQAGRIYRQVGADIEPMESGTDNRLMSVAQSESGDLAVAVGAFGTILLLVDGGQEWQVSSVDWFEVLNDYVEPHLYDVSISAEGVITVVGEFSLVLQSEDLGKTWIKRHSGDASLFAVSINAQGSGMAVGQEGAILRTNNAGQTWQAAASPVDDSLLNVVLQNGDFVVAFGIRNLIYSEDLGDNWVIAESTDLNTGWYQGLQLARDTQTGVSRLLLAGHHANILHIRIENNN